MNDREIYKYLGKVLTVLRHSQGYTQKNIADILGVSTQQVQKYESGKNSVSIAKLNTLKTLYGVPYETLFEARQASDNTDSEYIAPIFRMILNEKDTHKLYQIYSIAKILMDEC